MRKFDIAYALGDVNTYLVGEAIPGSARIKDWRRTKITTIASCACLALVLGIMTVISTVGTGGRGTVTTPPMQPAASVSVDGIDGDNSDDIINNGDVDFRFVGADAVCYGSFEDAAREHYGSDNCSVEITPALNTFRAARGDGGDQMFVTARVTDGETGDTVYMVFRYEGTELPTLIKTCGSDEYADVAAKYGIKENSDGTKPLALMLGNISLGTVSYDGKGNVIFTGKSGTLTDSVERYGDVDEVIGDAVADGEQFYLMLVTDKNSGDHFIYKWQCSSDMKKTYRAEVTAFDAFTFDIEYTVADYALCDVEILNKDDWAYKFTVLKTKDGKIVTPEGRPYTVYIEYENDGMLNVPYMPGVFAVDLEGAASIDLLSPLRQERNLVSTLHMFDSDTGMCIVQKDAQDGSRTLYITDALHEDRFAKICDIPTGKRVSGAAYSGFEITVNYDNHDNTGSTESATYSVNRLEWIYCTVPTGGTDTAEHEAPRPDDAILELLRGFAMTGTVSEQRDFDEYIKDYLGCGEAEATVNFTPIDMDGDGTFEAVFEVLDSDGSLTGTAIMYSYNGKVRIDSFSSGALYELRTDGTFGWWDVNEFQGVWRIEKFTDGGAVLDNVILRTVVYPDGGYFIPDSRSIVYVTADGTKITDGDSISAIMDKIKNEWPYSDDPLYFVNHEKVSEENYEKALEEQMAKDGVVWYDVADIDDLYLEQYYK